MEIIQRGRDRKCLMLHGIEHVPVEALEDPPALATHAGYDAVRAVVRRSGRSPVMVLSLEHILESVFRSALSEELAGEGE